MKSSILKMKIVNNHMGMLENKDESTRKKMFTNMTQTGKGKQSLLLACRTLLRPLSALTEL
jgi:hypothetical protein